MVVVTANNPESWLRAVWEALEKLKCHAVVSDEEWDDICTSMAWIEEELK